MYIITCLAVYEIDQPEIFLKSVSNKLISVLFSWWLSNNSQKVMIYVNSCKNDLTSRPILLHLVQFYVIKLFKIIILTFQILFENLRCTFFKELCFVVFQFYTFSPSPPQRFEQISMLLFYFAQDIKVWRHFKGQLL